MAANAGTAVAAWIVAAWIAVAAAFVVAFGKCLDDSLLSTSSFSDGGSKSSYQAVASHPVSPQPQKNQAEVEC